MILCTKAGLSGSEKYKINLWTKRSHSRPMCTAQWDKLLEECGNENLIRIIFCQMWTITLCTISIIFQYLLLEIRKTIMKTNQYRCLIWNETFDSKIKMNGLWWWSEKIILYQFVYFIKQTVFVFLKENQSLSFTIYLYDER